MVGQIVPRRRVPRVQHSGLLPLLRRLLLFAHFVEEAAIRDPAFHVIREALYETLIEPDH